MKGEMGHLMRKTVFGVSDQVQHKPGCTTTKDSYSLEILNIGSRGIVLFMKPNKGTDQLQGYNTVHLISVIVSASYWFSQQVK